MEIFNKQKRLQKRLDRANGKLLSWKQYYMLGTKPYLDNPYILYPAKSPYAVERMENKKARLEHKLGINQSPSAMPVEEGNRGYSVRQVARDFDGTRMEIRALMNPKRA